MTDCSTLNDILDRMGEQLKTIGDQASYSMRKSKPMHMIEMYAKGSNPIGPNYALRYPGKEFLYEFAGVVNDKLEEVGFLDEGRVNTTANMPVLLSKWTNLPKHVVSEGEWLVINPRNMSVVWYTDETIEQYYVHSNKDINYVDLSMVIHHKDGTYIRYDFNPEVAPFEIEMTDDRPSYISIDEDEPSVGIKLSYHATDIVDKHLYTVTNSED